MSSNIEIKTIEPIINQELFKLIKAELVSILDDINLKYNIQDSLKDKYNDNISNIGIKFGIKKRNRRILPNELQCMGRKLDCLQCTRSKRPGNDYCLSHIKNLPHGRIDDESFNMAKLTSGKKKNAFTDTHEDFIATHVEMVDNKQVLIDSNNNVYSYNIDAPVYLGKLINNTIHC